MGMLMECPEFLMMFSFAIVTKPDQKLKLFHVEDASIVPELITNGQGLSRM